MEGYTDSAFRTLCYRHGADLTFTEMSHVGSLLKGNRSTTTRVEARDSTPVQIQLLTGKEDELNEYLAGFTPFNGFQGFNLNLSCPSPDVIRRGKGAAMIKRVAKTQRLVDVFRSRGFPISVKLRLGTNAHEKSLKVYLNCLRGVKADFFVVHAKTASQGSSEASDNSVYPECVDAAAGIPVYANGDVKSEGDVRILREMGVSGVMIGRAALSDPSIFDALKNQLGWNNPNKPIPTDQELLTEYNTLAARMGSERHRSTLQPLLGK